MRQYSLRTQAKATLDDKAWSIISHLEGEARNYIINKAESERDTPEKVFEPLASRFGKGATACKCAKPSYRVNKQKKEDWMQYLDAWKGSVVKGIRVSLSLLNGEKSCSAS